LRYLSVDRKTRCKSYSCLTIRLWHLAQAAPTDLHIPILGQLPPTQLLLGDALEPGPLEIVAFDSHFQRRRDALEIR
jgi:hypothetical protein